MILSGTNSFDSTIKKNNSAGFIKDLLGDHETSLHG